MGEGRRVKGKMYAQSSSLALDLLYLVLVPVPALIPVFPLTVSATIPLCEYG